MSKIEKFEVTDIDFYGYESKKVFSTFKYTFIVNKKIYIRHNSVNLAAYFKNIKRYHWYWDGNPIS